MGALFSGPAAVPQFRNMFDQAGGAQAPPPPPLPPPPDPVAPPKDPPKQADDAVKQARADAEQRARGAAGMASTDVTKGALVTTAAPTAGKKLTGE